MKIYEYDIWNGDKGIIIAENEEQAKELYKQRYDAPIFPDEEAEDEEDTAFISYVCEVPTEPQLISIIEE